MKPRTIFALCVLLVVVPTVVGYGSYSLGFRNGSDSGYSQGHEVGYQFGNSSGYQLGYSGGYSQGNDTGYGNGYTIGYSYGNLSGYESGYQIGYASGNSSGYTVGFSLGFSEGNSTGYGNGYQNGQSSGSQSGYSQGLQNGNASGYQIGYLQGVKDGAGRGYNIRDPTYQEMLDFLITDQTDKNPYNETSYVCWNFASDLMNNAFKAGYKCGWVHLAFPNSAHAIDCFNTTDQGLVFVEPQSDDVVTLTIGQPYWDRTEYSPPSFDDTIVKYVVVW